MLKLFKLRNLDESSQTRRWFFKGIAMTGVAIASIAGLGADIRGGKTDMDYQAAYDRDVVPGDKILQQNGFEEIDQQEKDEIVQMFVDDYEHKKNEIS